MNFFLVRPGYTRINLYVAILSYTYGRIRRDLTCFKKLSPYLLCNSTGILFSYECVGFFAPKSFKNHRQKYLFYPFLNFIAHYLIFGIALIPGMKKRVLKLHWYHPFISFGIHRLWGTYNDVNELYEMEPKLTKKQQRDIWKTAFIGHWVMYFLTTFFGKNENSPIKLLPFIKTSRV